MQRHITLIWIMIFTLVLWVAIGITITFLSHFTKLPESLLRLISNIWIMVIFLIGGIGMAAVITRLSQLELKIDDQILTKNELLEKYLGNGTEDDPILIQSQKSKADTLEILNSSVSIVVSNCEFDRAFYIKCKNLTIEKCTFNECNFGKCSDIKINNSVVNRLLVLYQCHDVLLKKSTIQKFRLSYSHKNRIEKCNIDQISYKIGKNNLFEKNKIPASELLKIKNPTS